MGINGYEVVTTILSLILFLLVIRRIAEPFTCQCGHRSYFARGMFRHLQQAHRYQEPIP